MTTLIEQIFMQKIIQILKPIVSIYFLLITTWSYSQEDTLAVEMPQPKFSVDEYYKTKFSIFDKIKTEGDTIYLAPIFIDRKITIQNAQWSEENGLKKVLLNTYQVTKKV